MSIITLNINECDVECQRPEGLLQTPFEFLWQNPETGLHFNPSVIEACESFNLFQDSEGIEFTSINVFHGELVSLNIGQTVWYEYDVTNCDKMPDGIYWVNLSLPKYMTILDYYALSSVYIVTISGGEGVISAISELCEVI